MSPAELGTPALASLSSSARKCDTLRSPSLSNPVFVEYRQQGLRRAVTIFKNVRRERSRGSRSPNETLS